MSKYERRIKEFTVLFAVGGIIYSLVELAWRGRTHPSMGIAGGLCLCGLYKVRSRTAHWGLAAGAALGCALITSVEFIFGCVCNKALKLGVWDYSNRFCNLLGQICLLYTLLWFLICFPAFGICSVIKKHLFDRW